MLKSKFLFLLFIVFSSVTSAVEDISTPLKKFNSHGISPWITFEIKEDLSAFLLEVFGGTSTKYQVTDLIGPNGKVYVYSGANAHFQFHGYEQPILHNESSANRSLSVINKYGALLVPNFYSTELLPKGEWKVRLFSFQFDQDDVVKLRVVPSKAHKKERMVYIHMGIEKGSYWDQKESFVKEMIASAKNSYAEHNIELSFTINYFENPLEVFDGSEDIVSIIKQKKLKKILSGPKPSVKFLLLGKMKDQNKPINGISCLPGLYTASDCFAAMFADAAEAYAVTASQAGKILAHELGHHLGLFHTQDVYSMFINTIFDPFTDTPQEVTGMNMMDPGIHNGIPTFSEQQIHTLRKHPLVLDK